ncbi:unnamed protein product [Lampetra planeri]
MAHTVGTSMFARRHPDVRGVPPTAAGVRAASLHRVAELARRDPPRNSCRVLAGSGGARLSALARISAGTDVVNLSLLCRVAQYAQKPELGRSSNGQQPRRRRALPRRPRARHGK